MNTETITVISAAANVAMVILVVVSRWWVKSDDVTSTIQDLVVRIESMCRDMAHVERDIAQTRKELIQFREAIDGETGAKYYEHERRISVLEGRLNGMRS